MIAKKVEFVSASEAEIGNDAVVLYFQSDAIDELSDAIDELQGSTSDWNVGFTIGNESGDARTVDMEVLKGGVAHEVKTVLMGWISQSAGGQPLTKPYANRQLVTVGPGRVLANVYDSIDGYSMFFVLTNDSGVVTASVAEDGVITVYINLVMPDGSVVSSSGIAFT